MALPSVVRRLRVPRSTSKTQMSAFPSETSEAATRLPSGEIAALRSRSAGSPSRETTLPSRSTQTRLTGRSRRAGSTTSVPSEATVGARIPGATRNGSPVAFRSDSENGSAQTPALVGARSKRRWPVGEYTTSSTAWPAASST